MKVPNWFVVGSGLLALNLILVLGGTVSRHASAEAPAEKPADEPIESLADDDLKLTDQESVAKSRLELAVDRSGEKGLELPVLPEAFKQEPVQPAIDKLPAVPSLDSQPTGPGVLRLDDFKQVFNSLPESPDLLTPLDEMLKETPDRIPEQLSHSFFEGMKLRLQTAEHLTQSTLGLVEEAAIRYQGGDVQRAQELLGMATQLREMTAKLLVSH